MTYSLHASNGQQESASRGGDYVSAEEHRAMIDRAERSHAETPQEAQAAMAACPYWNGEKSLSDADRIEALEADGREATRLLDLWSEIPGAEDFAPYQDTMAFLGKPNSVGWVWAREVREERDFDKEQARQRDLAMQCICEAEEREQVARARIEALEAALREIKQLALSCKPAETPAALAHMVRICIDAGIARAALPPEQDQ
jgi:hypothetical protein